MSNSDTLYSRLEPTLLYREIAAWEAERNARQATVHWQFQTADARTRLARFYPAIPRAS